MKKQKLSCLLGLGLGLLGSGNLMAQWQTVDLFQQVSTLSAIGTDIGTGPDGVTLFSVGSAALDTSIGRAAVVRASADSGATWATIDLYSEPGWPWATYRGFGSGPDGSIYAAGELWNGVSGSGTKTWTVRQSRDAGATWTTVDAFYQGTGQKPSCSDVKVNPSGDVFAAGVSGNSSSNTFFYWTLRKRAAGSATWQTVDMVASGNINEAKAIGFHPTAGIFVAGRIGNANDNYRDEWTVRRSLDGGTTWTTVDSFQDGKSTASGARGIAVTGSGAIYVSGTAQQYVKGKLVNNWVVRRSLDGGATWTTVDKYGASSKALTAMGITVAPSGNLFVTGYSPDATSIIPLIVRKGTPGSNGTISWVTSDSFQLVSGQTANGQGITCDKFGNVFATGQAQVDSADHGYWITRKLAGPQ